MSEIYIGVDFGATKLNAVAITPTGEVRAKLREPTEATKGLEVVIKNIVSLIEKVISSGTKRRDEIRGIGIGAPGPLNPETGIIIKAPNLPGWRNVTLRDLIREKINLPVFLENDANAAAFGEYWLGAGKNAKVLLCLTLGTGVGGGVIINGKIFSGANFIGAELGHTIIKYDGLRCSCGNFGCLEAYVSATAIVQRTSTAIESGEKTLLTKMVNNRLEDLTAKLVHEAAKKGDRLAKDIMTETGKLLGIGITTLANIFNPDVVIIGGGVSRAGKFLLEPARQEVCKRAMPGIADSLYIVRAKLGEDSGAIGAAGIALFKDRKRL